MKFGAKLDNLMAVKKVKGIRSQGRPGNPSNYIQNEPYFYRDRDREEWRQA